jgi:hypothetical protein
MGAAPASALTRAHFSLPGEREWGVAEHSDGVFFVESASERVGPFPSEAAHREADRQNEYELLLMLAEAVLATQGEPGLARLSAEPRFATACDPPLAAAIALLHERGDYDECTETERGPVVRIDRFLALLEPGGVVVRECDSPAAAEDYFANWHLHELERDPCEEG